MKKLMMIMMIAVVGGLSTVVMAHEPEKIVARINGEVITVEEFDRMWGALSPEMRASYESGGGKLAFLDNQIRKRLLVQEALKEGLERQSDVAFQLRQARESALFDAYVRKSVARSIVTAEMVRAQYERRKSDLTQPEMAKARHIIATPQQGGVNNLADSDSGSKEEAQSKMMGIHGQLMRNPEGFAELAHKFSEDGTANAGGDLGWFGRGVMVPEFDEVVFDLEPGEISPVFETQYGYHIVLLEQKRPAGPPPIEEVEDQLREELLRERTSEVLVAIQQLTQELRAASDISVFRENL
jgi:peptidyl-prolyl cis-trans isomerase C